MSHDPSSNLSPILGEYLTLYLERKALEAKMETLGKTVREGLANAGTQPVEHTDGSVYSMKCEVMPGRRSLDTEELTEVLRINGYDIANFYKVGAPFTQLSIKKVN